MYIIIVGGGRVGYYLTKALLNEGHEILLLEERREICDSISKELGSVVLHGDGCETSTLEAAGTARADMLISVTGDDEDNLVSCQVAKYRFKVPRTLARVRNPKNESIFKKLGIETSISSTSIILEHIENEVPSHPLTHLLSIREKGLELLNVKIQDDSPSIGKSLKELSLPEDVTISLIIRKERKPIVPSPTTTIEAEDQIIVVAPADSEEEIKKILI
jgi:trk system potassium uptake protein TrkA